MPRGFSEREKTIIRQRLLERGRALFQTYGIRKTSVEDLTRAAGISKGAFYHFYSSKEALFLEILAQFQAEYQEHILSYELQPELSPRQNFHALMRRAFTEWKTNPLFNNLDQEEYAHLVRKLPAEALSAHAQRDEAFMARVIEALAGEGVHINVEPKTVANLVQALFFVQLHEKAFDPQDYPGLMSLLLELVTNYLVEP